MSVSVKRVYTAETPELREALAAAPSAELVGEDAPSGARLQAWALYGFRAWQAERQRAERIAAYEQVAQDAERSAYIAAANERAAQAGLL